MTRDSPSPSRRWCFFVNALAALACIACTVICFGGTFFGIWTDGRGNYQHGWPWYFCNRWDDPFHTRFLFWHGEVSWRPWALIGDILVLLAITLIIFFVARWLRTLQRPSISLRQGMLLLTTACVALGWWTAAAARGRSLESLEQQLMENNCSLEGSYNDPLCLQRLFGFLYYDPAFYRLGNCLHICEFPDEDHACFEPDEVAHLLDDLPQFKAVSFRTYASIMAVQQIMRHPRITTIEVIDFSQNDTATDDAIRELWRCESLNQLDLSGTEIGDNGVRHLLKVPRLIEVNVCRTNLTSDGLRLLATHPTLKRIVLRESGYCDESLGRLREKGLAVLAQE